MQKKREIRPVISMGMFDMFKGCVIILVVLGHTLDYFQDSGSFAFKLISFIVSYIGGILLNGFFIAAGFAFRKRSTSKCLKLLWKNFIVPYLYAAFATIALFGIVNTIANTFILGNFFSAVFSAVKSVSHHVFGFILGQYPLGIYFGIKVFSIGPLWFVIALAAGWFVLNFFMNHIPEKWIFPIIIILYIPSYWFSVRTTNYPNPICFTYIPNALAGLYIGYYLKKIKFYEKRPSWLFWIILCISTASVFISILLNNANSFFNLLLPIFIYPLSAYSVYLFTHINRSYNGFVNVLEKIGHHSLEILCVHTVEYFGMHWHLLIAPLSNHPVLGFFITLILRSLFIVIGMKIVMKYKKNGGWKQFIQKRNQQTV